MEVHPCANSSEDASPINDFDDGLSTCSELEDVPEPEGDKDGDEGENPIIDMAEFEELDEIPVAGKTPASEKTSTTPIARDGQLREAPTIFQASAAVEDLKKLLKPPRDNGKGYKDPKINEFVRIRMQGMQSLLNLFIHPSSSTFRKWVPSSMQAAFAMGKGTVLPINPFGDWNQSMLLDEDLASDINLYMQEA